MVGFDVGFKKGGRVHSKNSFYDDKKDTANGSPVRGNFSNNIYSTDLLNLSRQNLEMSIFHLKPKKVYNLSDGAFINGTIPIRSNQIKLKKIDKQKGIKRIVSSFKKEKIKLLNYKGFLELYKTKIIELLDVEVKNRGDLTKVVDLINEYTFVFSQYEPAVGILMRGTVWHILNALYLSLHKTDIKEYKNMVKIIKNELKNYKLS
jgi:hypothetical protein